MRARTICAAMTASVLALLLAFAGPARADDTVAIALPAETWFGLPLAVTISGTAEQGRLLAAWTLTAPARCSEGPQPGSTMLVPERPVAGDFSVPASITPAFGVFSHWLGFCAVLISEPGRWSPSFADADTYASLEPSPGAVTVQPNGPLNRTVPTTLTASGSTAVPRALHVTIKHSETDCRTMTGAVQTLTPPAGIPLPAGPFSVTLPFTPDGVLTNSAACAFLTETGNGTSVVYSGGGPINVGPKPPPPPPVVQPTAPADGARGSLLNPTFTWIAPGGASDFTLTLRRVEGGKEVPLLSLTTREYRTLNRAAARAALGVAGSGATSEIADVARTEGDEVTLRLRAGLAPGDYVWTLEHPRMEDVPPRRFTVEPVPLERLRVQAQRREGRSSARPLAIRFSIDAVPYARIVLRLRVNGRARVFPFTLARNGRVADTIRFDCRTPGLRIRWEVVATDQLGNRELRRGVFEGPTRARCAALVRAEQRAFARRVAEIRRVANPYERFRRMCRLFRGRLGTATRNGQRMIVCRGPNGGLMRLPN